MSTNTTKDITLTSITNLMNELKNVVQVASDAGVDKVWMLDVITAQLKSVMGGYDVQM